MFWHTQMSYEFGPFRVDTRERQLLRSGQPVPLRPKVFDVLLALVQHRGHILTKDDVMRLVWPDTAVEEGNITRNISTLRSVLGERPREHQYIETIPWRGYRFIANVREVIDAQSTESIDSIAVLPFVNIDADPKKDYLLEGLAESLITSLAQLTNLRVISRSSAFRYRGPHIDAQTVGRELKVQAVLMGRLTVRDDLLSISVELVDSRDDRHIWGAQYLRKPGDVFSVPKLITREIVQRLSLETSRQEQQLLSRSSTQNNDAYLCYLKGRYHFNKLSPEGVEKGIEYCHQAIAKDPNYSRAYAALADCHNYLARRDDARQAVLKALELDEQLGEAHASLGFYHFLYDWDFRGAEREFERALELSPNYASAHHWYAVYLANLGRHDKADREARRAVELDPLSLMMNMTPALNFYLARQFDQAIEVLNLVIEMDPNFMAARSVRGSVLVEKGLYEEAITEYERLLELIRGVDTAEASVKAMLAHALVLSGKQSQAMRLLDEVVGSANCSPYFIARIYAAMGQADAGFALLNKAFEQRDIQLVSLKVDPTLDSLRSDPRFPELVGRVGLPQSFG